jgi:carbamoyl-phosphate synthase large subunit
MLNKLGLFQPANGTAMSEKEAVQAAETIGYPVIVRPSYVLGGRAMKIVYDRDSLVNFTRLALEVSPEHPVLIDRFLEQAIELDVDAVCDGADTVICGIMEHIEAAGIHSGDSACVLPPYSLGPEIIDEIASATRAMALELNVVGLMNVQYAVQNNRIFVLEVNPRASRTVPFVSKATGIPWAKVATRVMLGRRLRDMNLDRPIIFAHVAVKESVLPFDRFPDVDTLLGPEMKSTGEVMGIDSEFGLAFAKAQLGAGQHLPTGGTVFISVKDEDKPAVAAVAKSFQAMGFRIMATEGTSRHLRLQGIENQAINKVSMGQPHVVDAIKNREIHLVINTESGGQTKKDGYEIRRATIKFRLPYATTVAGALAVSRAVQALRGSEMSVKPIQEYHFKHA